MLSIKEIFNETSETTNYLCGKLTEKEGEEVFEGSNGPIVAIHGVWGGWPSDGLRKYMVEKQVAGILCDFGPLTKSVDSYLSDLNSILNRFSQPNILGFSTGGIVALRYTQLYGWEKIRKLITVGSPFNGIRLFEPLKKLGGVFTNLSPKSLLLNKLFDQVVPDNRLTSIFARKDQYVGDSLTINIPGTKIVIDAAGHGNLQNHADWIKEVIDKELGFTK